MMPLFIHSHLDCGDLFYQHLGMYNFHKPQTFADTDGPTFSTLLHAQSSKG